MINWNTRQGNRLIAALMRTETSDQMEKLLDDLLTEKEIETCIKRLNTAYQLSLGVPYSFIEKTTDMSSKTIARIAKQLDTNDSGYSQALKRLNPHGSRKGIFLD